MYVGDGVQVEWAIPVPLDDAECIVFKVCGNDDLPIEIGAVDNRESEWTLPNLDYVGNYPRFGVRDIYLVVSVARDESSMVSPRTKWGEYQFGG